MGGDRRVELRLYISREIKIPRKEKRFCECEYEFQIEEANSQPASKPDFISFSLPIQTDLKGAETHLTAVGCKLHGAEAAVPIQSETPMPEWSRANGQRDKKQKQTQSDQAGKWGNGAKGKPAIRSI